MARGETEYAKDVINYLRNLGFMLVIKRSLEELEAEQCQNQIFVLQEHYRQCSKLQVKRMLKSFHL